MSFQRDTLCHPVRQDVGCQEPEHTDHGHHTQDNGDPQFALEDGQDEHAERSTAVIRSSCDCCCP